MRLSAKRRFDTYLRLAAKDAPPMIIVPANCPRGKKEIRTWREGEVGVWGTRRVLPGGIITVADCVYQDQALDTHVGCVVYFGDDDDAHGIGIHEAEWYENGHVSGGNFICRARRVTEFEMIEAAVLDEIDDVCCTEFDRLNGVQDLIDTLRDRLKEMHKAYDQHGEDRSRRAPPITLP